MTPQPRPNKELFIKLAGGNKMPQNGLGMCCRYAAYDDVLVRRNVLWYLLLGGRLIDTADLYLNHKAIGLGIQDAIERGIPRSEIFVTTKLWPTSYGYNSTLDAVPRFLEELGLEYIDLVLMHFPYALSPMNNDCTRNGVSNKDCRIETWKALTELTNQGVMRNVGVSNFLTKHLKDITELDGYNSKKVAPISVNQICFNPWIDEYLVETNEFCHKNKIGVTAYASLGGVLQHSEMKTVETLQSLSDKYGRSTSQILLRWAMQKNIAVIAGTGNPSHMKENLGISSFQLSKQDMAVIDELRNDESARKLFSYKGFPLDQD